MKKLLPLLLLFSVLNHASAALPFVESFADSTSGGGTAYAVGSSLITQKTSGNLWDGIGTGVGTTFPTIVAGNLSYINLPTSTGNSVLIASASSQGGRLNLNATVTAGRAYYSYVLKVTNLDNVSTEPMDNWFSGFGDGTGSQATQVLRIGGKVLTKKSGDGYVFGVGKTATTGTYVYDNHVYAVGDTVFIVAAYEQIAGSGTNALVWINPPLSSFGSGTAPTPTLSVSTPGTPAADGILNNSGVKSLILACQKPTAPTVIVDEVRVGTTWAAVVPVSDPSIQQNPVNKTVPPGASADFTVVAGGTGPFTYQWVKNGTTLLTDGGNISGANTTNLHVGNVSLSDVAAYSVIVTNSLGNIMQSSPVNLVLSDPAITGQPQNRTNNYGTTATFTVTLSGTAPFNYQWNKEGVGTVSDGGNISGAQTATLTLNNVSFSDAGNYFVTVGNSLGGTNSVNAVLTVNDPVILTQPMSVSNTPNSTVSFHVMAEGSPSLIYQWRKGTNYIFDDDHYSGTTTDTLTISGISSTYEANYNVVVISAANPSVQIISSNATLIVLNPVSITAQPASRTVTVGAKVSLGVVAVGAPPLSYQWYLGGAVISGATSAVYTLSNVQVSAQGNYSVVVSNQINSATSAPTALNISTNLQLFETNLVVVRVGDISQPLGVNGNSMFLDQFDKHGNYVNTVNIPDEDPTGMVAIGWDNITGVNNGSTTGTSLTRSLDGRFMVVAGYNTNLSYGANLSTSPATNVPRGIALINSHSQYKLRVASTSSVFNQTYWRAAVSDGTNNFWGVGGISGTYYFGFDADAALIQTTFINSRSMGLFNGNIYCATAASPTGVLKVDGMPKTAGTSTVLFNASTGTYDLAVSPDGNLIYVADQRVLTGGGGIQRYDLVGTNWTLTYTLQVGGPGTGAHGPRYLAADFSGANPVIYATGNDNAFDNNRILKVEDTGSGSTQVVLAYAGANQTFRGINFGPVASPAIVDAPVLSITRNGANVILSWSGSFNLQSSTNVSGTYNNVSGATSPYTNSVSSPSQLFFRLQQ